MLNVVMLNVVAPIEAYGFSAIAIHGIQKWTLIGFMPLARTIKHYGFAIYRKWIDFVVS
jgi:hypothetical protein